jgi:hypothetical protein
MSSHTYLIIVSLLAIASLSFSGCTTLHSGIIQGNANLSGNDFRYAGRVSASNRTVYVLGMGGAAKQNQVEQLREELLTKYPLRSGLAWANVGVTYRSTDYLFLVVVNRATLVLDIIDYWPDTNTLHSDYTGYYLNPSKFIFTQPLNNNVTPQNASQSRYQLLIEKLAQAQSEVNLNVFKNVTPMTLANIKEGDIALFYLRNKYIVCEVATIDAEFKSITLFYPSSNYGEVIEKTIAYKHLFGIYKPVR